MGGLIVKTSSGKKGYAYYEENHKINSNKIKVRLVDENLNLTGENLLCRVENVTTIGHIR